mmetsp:Transcript_38696/g.83369  ORF Transcript_38696/g.83369 Transcript_38696/m.83369 type:complete len:862 (+) Transcript_38696:40-2625(+)
MIPSPLRTLLVTLTLLFPCALCSPKSSPDKKPSSNQYLRSTSVVAAAITVTVSDNDEQHDPIVSLSPPIARREENRVVYAGIAPPQWDPTLPRQSANSTNPLLNPPNPIPDPYGWIRDDTRTNPEILHHLTAENEYTQNYTSHLKGLRDTLYEELVSSLVETDYSMPRPKGEWMYYKRTFEGRSYGSYCRAPRSTDTEEVNDWDGSKDSPILPGEEVYLDVNELAVNRTYCSVGTVSMSPSRELVAYTVDYSGNEVYELHIRNFTSGEDVVLKKTATGGGRGGDDNDDLLELDDFVWGKDDTTLYYTTMDDAHRSYRLYKRENWKSEVNNNDSVVDTLLKEEDDALFSSGIGKSLDERYIFYVAESEETSEVWYIDLLSTSTTIAADGDDEENDSSHDDEEEEMKCVSLRRNNVQYDVESHGDSWYIITNVNNSENRKLMVSPAKSHSEDDWELVLDGDGNPLFDGSPLDKKSLNSINAFETHAVLEGREDGIPRVWMYSFETKELTRLEFEDAAYDVGLSANHEVDTDKIAISYSSMLTPPSTIEVSLEDYSQRRVLKTNAVPGYDKDLYGTNRLHVLSRDGNTQIPISVVYRKDTMEKVEAGQPVPIHLYGYGSYGSSIEADFGSSRLPLLNRGMIYVIAHVRGGGELGRSWYEEPNGAKLLCKENTFNDFVDVARFLVGNDWTTPELLSCEGRSAGGLLIGASINQDPELFRVAILGVPFVDVAVTMTDASIPLTTGEWIEWGNPNEEKYFQYMMDYSPMNNVQTGKKYPSCLITGGLHDPRVAYWEPTKFAATLRHANPDNENPVCMKVDMSSGHFSASDRYEHYRGLAYDYSFVLDQLGLGERHHSHGEFQIAVAK